MKRNWSEKAEKSHVLLEVAVGILKLAAEDTPVILAPSLGDLLTPLKNAFPQRRFLVSPVRDFVSFSVGVCFSLKIREREKRDLNVGQGSTVDVLAMAQPGEVLGDVDFASWLWRYPQVNLLCVCLDSQLWSWQSGEGYINTPWGAATRTTPVGLGAKGNWRATKFWWEVLPLSVLSYAAQISLSHRNDFEDKVRRALGAVGIRFLNTLTPSSLDWRFLPQECPGLMEEAVETGFWPLFEVMEGHWRLSLDVKRQAVAAFYKRQGRFAHLFDGGGEKNIKNIEEALSVLWQSLRDKLKTTATKS